MIPLSVVIITFNEERNIRRCLNSIQEVADDVVVVDSFSTDQTKIICLEYEVNLIEHIFEGHIEQKNYAITQAKYPHILSLDADEALDETLKKSILEVKQNWKYDGYYMNRLTNYCGQWIRHSGWYPDRKLRLWNSKKGTWKGINPHDQYIMKPEAKVGSIKGDILHYSFYTMRQHVLTTYNYVDISARAKIKEQAKINPLKLFFSPIWMFISSYFLKQGFRDGFFGLLIAVTSAYGSFMKYALVLYYKRKGLDN